MSIWKNGKLIAGGSQALPLLSFMWTDHQLNHPSWLRADTFSWQSGAVYQAAYAHLADDIDGKTLQSETVSGITVQFYVADDGHKICPDTEESNVLAIYNATGVAWYYILDTENQQFKLPRAKKKEYITTLSIYGRTQQLSGNAGSSAPLFASGTWTTGAIATGGAQTNRGATTDVQEIVDAHAKLEYTTDSDQYKYLYFYVGQFTQTALENTAGLNTELFNGKVDKGHQVIVFQAPTAENNYTWYRLYADGWVEQGGVLTQSGNSSFSATITFPIVMIDNNYNISFAGRGSNNTAAGNYAGIQYTNESTTGVGVYVGNDNTTFTKLCWQVSGMAAN